MKKTFLYVAIICGLLSGCSELRNTDILPEQHNSASSKKFVLPKEARILLREGVVKLKSGNVSGAVADFEDLTKLYPSLPAAHYNLGLAYARNNQIIDAIKSWESTVSLDENNADAYYNLGQAYKETRNNKKAVENLSKYLMLKPEDVQVPQIKNEIARLKEANIGDGIIGRITISDKADLEKKIVLESKDILNNKVTTIFAGIELVEAPANTDLKLNWYFRAYDNQRIPVNSSHFKTKGSRNLLISLEKPKTNWPTGKYEFEILVNGKENSVIPFYIQK